MSRASATNADAPARKGRRFRLASRASIWRLAILAAVLVGILSWVYAAMLRMPGASYRGPLDPLTPAQAELAAELRRDVAALAGGIGHRSTFYPAKLAEAAAYIAAELAAAGYEAEEHSFPARGAASPNLQGVLAGRTRPGQVVVIGAHYDSYQGTPGADDNASGVAAVLALARRFAGRPQDRTIRFVFFVNEEPPAFMTEDMGSLIYARACRAAGDEIVAMLSLESIGYFDTAAGSQAYPAPLGLLYPSTGDFVAFIGNYGSRRLVRRCVAVFRERARFPSEGAALFQGVPGVGWSDHWAFWQTGYPALMVTGTAPFRNPNYHLPSDALETLDYERMARVVDGLEQVVLELAGAEGRSTAELDR